MAVWLGLDQGLLWPRRALNSCRASLYICIVRERISLNVALAACTVLGSIVPELVALSRSLGWLLRPGVLALGVPVVTFRPDSDLAVAWLEGTSWVRPGSSDFDLWQLAFGVRLLYLHASQHYRIIFECLLSHTGIQLNELVDRAAKAAAQGSVRRREFFAASVWIPDD